MHCKEYGKTGRTLSVIGCGGMRLDESRGIAAGDIPRLDEEFS